MPLDDKEKRLLEEDIKEKKKEEPFYKRLSPIVLIVGGVIIFFFIRNMTIDSENRNTYLFWIAAILLLLYLLGKSKTTQDEGMLTPQEAERLVEMECFRKINWGQFPEGSKYSVGPINPLYHKDGGGVYYQVSTTIEPPFDKPVYYTARVQAKGVEKGFVTFMESIGRLNGRERVDEKSLIPPEIMAAHRSPVVERLLFRGKQQP